MENKVVFIDGVNVFTPRESAPDFVKADLVINKEKLITWLQSNGQHLRDGKYGKELRLTIKQSVGGKLYASVDTFNPKPKTEVTLNGDMANQFNESQSVTEDDMPF